MLGSTRSHLCKAWHGVFEELNSNSSEPTDEDEDDPYENDGSLGRLIKQTRKVESTTMKKIRQQHSKLGSKMQKALNQGEIALRLPQILTSRLICGLDVANPVIRGRQSKPRRVSLVAGLILHQLHSQTCSASFLLRSLWIAKVRKCRKREMPQKAHSW